MSGRAEFVYRCRKRPEAAMMRRWHVVLAMSATTLLASGAAGQAARPEMCGRWKGTADIIVNWTKARTLPVEIAIAADDRVTGKIGDATILNGRFRANRGWLGRALHIKTDWLIDGRLEGPIIAAESIARDELLMPLNFRGMTFEGGIATSGSKIGDRDTMVLTARVILRRAPDMVVCEGPGATRL
jgi:hypothetical protein